MNRRSNHGRRLGMPTTYRVPAPVLSASLMRPSCVTGLFDPRGPTDVAWFVVALVVDAVEREVCSGARSHVGIERREARAPTLTHLNATAPVVLEMPMPRVVASLNHPFPCGTFGAVTEAVRPMTEATAARLRLPGAQRADQDVALNPTHAATAQAPDAVATGCFRHDGPMAHDGSWGHDALQDVRHRHSLITSPRGGLIQWT